jgi:transcriptional regulator with XRE-family HTH domain
MTTGDDPWSGPDIWKDHLQRLGDYIKAQRQVSQLSQRQLATMANLSDTYMSQLERGLHEPSIRVLRSIATGLGLDPDDLIRRAASLHGDEHTEPPVVSTEAAIKRDERLTDAQKQVLLSVLKSYVDDAH